MVRTAVFKTVNAGSSPVFSVLKKIYFKIRNYIIKKKLKMVKFLINSSIKKELINLNKLSKKRLIKVAKLSFPPEQAKISPALAQLGISSMEFCEKFNYQTRGWDKELVVLVKLNVFSDKSFSFSLKPFILRDLVTSFDLDLFWLHNKKEFNTEALKNSKVNEFFLSFYRAFLVYKNFGFIKINTFEQFVKTSFSYLKSFQ